MLPRKLWELMGTDPYYEVGEIYGLNLTAEEEVKYKSLNEGLPNSVIFKFRMHAFSKLECKFGMV